jgi:uncharacterized protein DUF4382
MNFTRSINSPRRNANRALVLVLVFAINAATFFTNRVSAGTLEVRLKDHREAIGDFSRLEIIVDTLRISPKSGLKFWQIGWKELSPVLNKVDLAQYTGTRSAMIFRGEVSDGSFEGIDLKLKSIEGMLKNGKVPASVKNLVGPIQAALSVSSKHRALIVLDFVVIDVSDHPPAGYELRLRGYELYIDGKLTAKAPG